jgi:hypothetical protein
MSEYLNNETIKQELAQFLTSIMNDMKAVMDSENMNATGKSRDSFKVEVDGFTGILYGPSHINVLESGRGPTRGGKGGGVPLVQRILQWIQAKGIQARDGITQQQLAYAITNKIHREGTLRYINKEKSGIISNVLTDQRFQSFFNTFAETTSNELFSNIVKKLPAI